MDGANFFHELFKLLGIEGLGPVTEGILGFVVIFTTVFSCLISRLTSL
jgi:hypothetical protein